MLCLLRLLKMRKMRLAIGAEEVECMLSLVRTKLGLDASGTFLYLFKEASIGNKARYVTFKWDALQAFGCQESSSQSTCSAVVSPNTRLLHW